MIGGTLNVGIDSGLRFTRGRIALGTSAIRSKSVETDPEQHARVPGINTLNDGTLVAHGDLAERRKMIRTLAVLIWLPLAASAQEVFQLPSRNVHCFQHQGELFCEVLAFSFTPPPRPRNCNANWGNAVMLGGSGPARLVCHGDPGEISGYPVLGYGQTWQGPRMTCTAAQAGLRCENVEGRGFELSRARLRMF